MWAISARSSAVPSAITADSSACTKSAHSVGWCSRFVVAPLARLTAQHASTLPVASNRHSDIGFALGYLVVFVYVAMSFRSLERVYSRLGLFMTSATDMLVAALVSMSLCTLFGFNMSVVPWCVRRDGGVR